MAKQGSDKEKVVTPALGAEGATDLEKEALKDDQSNGSPSENKEELATSNLDETGSDSDFEDDEFEAPEWAVALFESNQAVIDSNNELIESIEDFKEFGKGEGLKIHGEVVEVKPDIKVKAKAKYVVAKGKKFVDIDNPARTYKEGDDVSKLDIDRLLNLLNQGIIEESK